MKNIQYDVSRAKQRCSNWLQNQHQFSEGQGEDPTSEPQSDPLHDTLTASADEDVSNQSQIDKSIRKIQNPEESISEFSETSQDRPKNAHVSHIDEEIEMDTSVASDDVPGMNAKKAFLHLRQEKLHLSCGWKDCTYETTKNEPFLKHVASHIPELEIKCNEDEEVYACMWELCNFETPNPDEVARHVNFHAYHTKMKCIGALICKSWKLPECSNDGAGVNLVPDLPEPLQCLWDGCSFLSNNPNLFFGHVQHHAHELIPTRGKTLSEEKFDCLWRGCKTKGRNKKRIAEHLRLHSKERIAACPTCGVLYASRMRLIDHIKRQAQEESLIYQCTHCSRSYPSVRILREHMRKHVNHYKCQFCDMTCSTTASLSSHIRYRHLDEKPFACQFCDYKAKTQYNLTRHLTTHSTTDNFFCEEEDCNFSCRTISILNWHYRKMHDAKQVYVCHMCDSRFARGAYLTQHLMKKHNFRWPSGHTRFRFFKHHKDGFYRLQTVRYESLDVVEDINRGEGEHESVLKPNAKVNIVKETSTKNDYVAASFVVRVDQASDEDPDDPDDPGGTFSENEEVSKSKVGQSMPSLDSESPPISRKVLISIDEVDTEGNIVCSKLMEAEEVTDMEIAELDNVQLISDGGEIRSMDN